MASGAGLMVDAIQSLRNNRKLLKGKNQSVYKNFDRESYQVKGPLKKTEYKSASPEILQSIRNQMISEQKRENRSSMIILMASLILSIGIMVGLGRLYIWLFF